MFSCSTTKRLEEDEVLYTGVKKISITAPDSVKLPDGVTDQIKSVLDVAPNNPLYSPYVRTPFPVGLWVYNNWTITPKTGKVKKWLYNLLVSDPVLVSTVRPEMRMKMLQDLMDNNGYFGSSTTYEIIPDKKNPKKARISYSIKASKPYKITTVQLIGEEARRPLTVDTLKSKSIGDKDKLTHTIDSLAQNSTYLKTGNIYNTDSLNSVRTNISTYLRNKGYYYFRPEFIEYLADSTINEGKIALKMIYAPNIPKAALRKFYVGNVETTVNRYEGGGVPDTTLTQRGTVIQMKPSHLRSSLIPSCVTFRKGRAFTLNNVNRTQAYLSRLGIFKSINIDITPLDSLKPKQDTLDVNINCTFDAPLEASFEVNTAYKSNSYLGPGLGFGISHNNLFGGGEKLSLDLTGSYEWQIGKASGSNSGSNYYEFGITSSLSFPRLLAPRFIQRIKREINWTKISLSANLYNDPSSIKFFQTSAALTYQWRSNRNSMHELSLPKLTYSKRLREPAMTDSSYYDNNQDAWSDITKRSEFIPLIAYTYTLDYSFGKGKVNNIVWRSTVSEAGNMMAGLWSLFKPKETGVRSKKVFGVPFSQFVKLETQLVYSRQFLRNQYIVWRGLVGSGFVYGNSDYLPYGEDFYAGGPNTIRAFGIKSLGPGSFKDIGGYNSQFLHSGSFEFVTNVEYRFPIVGIFHGAVFVDAGNVWLLKDPLNAYPGGLLKGDTFFKDIALGTGFGIRIDLSMLVVRADLGIGIHAPYDTGKSGYYNMTSFKNSLALNFAVGYPF